MTSDTNIWEMPQFEQFARANCPEASGSDDKRLMPQNEILRHQMISRLSAGMANRLISPGLSLQ